jgi:glutamate synthase (NADPH/NADH) large chain
VGAEENTGDGAGIMVSMPDEFMRGDHRRGTACRGPLRRWHRLFSTGISPLRVSQEQAIANIAKDEGLEVLAWRAVPTNPDGLGLQALASMPSLQNVGCRGPRMMTSGTGDLDLDRKTFRLRKRIEHEVGVYFASLSSRTITYKGMLTTLQLTSFFPDLLDTRMKATIAIVHSRFSTNTFPSWPLAQPFRLIAHNGEINTIQGNRNWLSAREGRLSSKLLGEFKPLLPICTPGASDSGTFDECLELLHLSGRSITHAISMMLPPAWEKNDALDPDIRAFYEYNNSR